MTNKKLGNDFEAELCEMLAKNGFWAHKDVTEREVLFGASVYFNCSIKRLVQGQILSYIRHTAFYNYDKTANAIRSPELKKEYHDMVNKAILDMYPWTQKYRYKEKENDNLL